MRLWNAVDICLSLVGIEVKRKRIQIIKDENIPLYDQDF